MDTGTAKLYHHYGYNGASGLRNLHQVPTFLAQTQLTYIELVSLLKTQYLNPGLYKIKYLDFIFKETSLSTAEIYSNLDKLSIPANTIAVLHSDIREAMANNHIKPNKFKKWIEENFEAIKNVLTLHQEDTTCTLATTSMRTIKHIYEATTTPRYLSNAVLQKLHTFIRLWRKTGWSIQDFDTVVTSIGTSTFDQAFLNKLSYAKQFIDTTALTPKKAAALWGTMDYRTDNNLYTDLFLQRTQEIPDAFVPSPERNLFSELTTTANAALSNFTEVLLSAFGISEIALMAIYSGTPGLDADARISIENISTIYRHVLFASVLDIPVSTLMEYLQLLDIHPFTDPKSTLDAYHTVQKMTSGGFTPKWLAYVLQDDAVQYDDLVFGETAIQKSKLELLKKYVEIEGKTIALEEGQLLEDAQNDLKREATYDYLANLVSVPVQILKALLEKEVGTGTVEDFIENASYPDQLNGLARAASVVQKFSLEAHEVLHFVVHTTDFEDLDITQLNRNGFWQLYQYNQLKNEIEKEGEKLTEIFTYAVTTSPGTKEELLATIHKVTSWDIANIKYLLEHLFTDIADFKNTAPLTQMSRMIGLANSMGVTVASLDALKTEPNPDFELLWDTAQKVKLLLKAKYEHSTWVKVATKLNDQLRELQRDALVAYCLILPSIRNHELEVKDANGLYEFFLLDVQMSACMDTSRIVQASAAIQQFVNRSHLNLEKRVKVEALDRGRWLWMQHYRVWEAQMRVWYENETLLNPEWRMDKTPFFKELESYLTQNDITDRTAEEALRTYVRRMDEVSNLNVAGMYEEKYEDGSLKLLHVFGHTNNTPYTYYYRTYNEFGKWSAWEKVDAAIQAVSHSDADTSNGDKKTGVHLIPIVWKNRLLLFWPEFMQKAETTSSNEKTFKELAEDGTTISSREPKKYWEVRLAWSEYDEGVWTPKQLSEKYLTLMTSELVTITDETFISSTEYRDPLYLNNISFGIDIADDSVLDIYMVPFVPRSRRGGLALDPGDEDFGNLYFNSFRIINIHEGIGIDTKLIKSSLAEAREYQSKVIFGRYLNSTLDINGYNFMKTTSSNDVLKIGNTYFTNSVEHQLLFPSSLNYTDYPLDFPFFFSTQNKTYFVKRRYTDHDLQKLLNELRNSNSLGEILVLTVLAGGLLSVVDFSSFHHPFSSNFISNLNLNGIGSGEMSNPGLLESDIAIGASDGIFDDYGSYFEDTFNPKIGLIHKPSEQDLKNPLKTYFKETVDFDPNGANSQYNWELFYHAPLYIATQLSKNGQYREAVKWFHYLFDPTTDTPVETGPSVNEIARFFKVKPFKTIDTRSFEKFIEDLEANPIGNEENKRIKEWRENPFNPHLIASSFHVNYMKHLVLAYVENLVHWGDSLFRRFTRENVYEAIQLYVIAGHILGPKPQFIPKRGVIKKETYASIRGKLTDLSNAYVSLENSRPYSSTPSGAPKTSEDNSFLGNAPALYFCTPPNKRLLKYWDLVEDRLYKIRNCKDINGITRRLALFAPPIDPAALIKAKSAGLDLDDVIGNLNTPPPHYRFMYLLQKANEFCNDVKALGASVLSAIEKSEGEALSQLRSVQEVELLGMVQKIRERQVLDAKTAKELLEKQRETAMFRFTYYNETLLGNDAVEIPPVIDLELDLDENSIIPANPDIQEIVPDVNTALVDGNEQGIKTNSKEALDFWKKVQAKRFTQDARDKTKNTNPLHLIPSISAQIQPFGAGVSVSFGSQNIISFLSAQSSIAQMNSGIRSQEAGIAATIASYIRREQDWTLQANLAAKEVQLLERQILSAGIRVQIAEKELENHKQQLANAETIENYIKTKFSNKELYQWMKEQLISVHKQSYDMAFELARKAEMAFEYEKGALESPIVAYGHFKSAKNGLLAGEKLQLELRRLELAYQEKNVRELELTKHISLQLLDPLKLAMLKETGQCSFELFEELFDLDYPGHYNRRIKSVSLSIPCITGPHTTIACTLRLKSSSIRTQTKEDKLLKRMAPVSKVATSTGQNDSGVYELNFRDERYLPFEGSGVISSWDLELFYDENAEDKGKSLRQFDYDTIADVVLHIRYTAVEEGEFKTNRISALKQYLNGNSTLETEDGTKTLHLLKAFNLKQEFPSKWHKMLHPADGSTENILEFNLKQDHFPYRDKGQKLEVNALHLLANTSGSGNYRARFNSPLASGSAFMELTKVEDYGELLYAKKDTSGENIELDFSGENLWNLEVVSPSGELLSQDELNNLLLVLEYKWK
ncbi:MAG: neuraminidase-like domain-containing protein [Bacteroidota bacterium]